MKNFKLTIYFILSILCCNAQNIPSLGNPFIQNYTKAQYKGGNQNWAIAQGHDGIIYIANNNGLLTFDGSYWDIYPIENHDYVRSVTISPDGKIYIGGKEEFGYFIKENGKFKYHKLSHLVSNEILQNDEIWKILIIDNKVIFQSFSKLYVYENKKITIVYGDGEPFLFAHKINNKIWVEKIPSGIQKWNNNKFLSIDKKINNVLSILPFKDNKYLVSTAKNGFYLLSENGNVEKWIIPTQLEEKLQNAQINNGIKIDDNHFAFGTIKNGIFIINKNGMLIQHIYKRNGLQNNTVLSLMLDQQGNIWAGLDNGIDRIEINSPFYYYKDIFGELGTVYAIKFFENKIYLGTNQGLFYSSWNENNNTKSTLDLKFIPGSQGQVWSLENFNNKLICGHNEGTYSVINDKLIKISNYTGGWINKQSNWYPNIFVQGNYTGLATFQMQNDISWELNHKFDKPKNAILDLINIDSSHYWIVFNNSIQLIKFGKDFKNYELLNTFNFKSNFPNIRRLSVASIQENTLFITDKGVFLYDNVLSEFKPYKEINEVLGSFSRSKVIKKIKDKTYFFACEGRYAQVIFDKDKILIDSTNFQNLENMVMKNYEIVEPYNNKLIFGLDNGIAIYDTTTYKTKKILAPIIKGFQYLSSTSNEIFSFRDKTIISNDKNNIRILFSSPWYSANPIKYQYILEGTNLNWSTPNEMPYIDLTNLKWGTYVFLVKAITITGETSDITKIKFTVEAPWYISWKALILYIILLILLFYWIKRLTIAKIKKDKLLLTQKIRKEQEELLRKKTEENEKKLIVLRNEQLSQELELKSRELANAATNILYKNELLNNLHEELLNLKDQDGKKLSNDQIQKISKLIHNARSDERDWDIFEKSFNESHGNFFKKLKKDYPTLSPNDLKLCAYLRLNMSSKDIASIINISIRGVEIKRYRLRKKFNLPSEKNLNEFLMEL